MMIKTIVIGLEPFSSERRYLPEAVIAWTLSEIR